MKKHYTLLIFLIIAVFGAILTRHYGESWDELQFYKYADSALRAYVTWPLKGEVEISGNTYDNYGPAFVMLVALGAKALHTILPWYISDLRHLIYFFTYLAGVWAFYELSKRWLSSYASIGATLLFLTQPVFWGHAFISPKDIPFLSFSLLSLLFGLRLFDSFQPIQLNDMVPRSKQTLLALSALWLAIALGLFLFTDAFHSLITHLVQSAKAGETNIISMIASDIDKVDAEVYIQRYFVFFLWLRSACLLLATSIFAFYAYRIFPRSDFQSLLSVFFPAVLLGVSTSIRILGPFIAVIVAIYAFHKLGKGAIIPFTLYAIIAVIAMYLTWPYLWLNPIGHFMESVQVMSGYPWKGIVLFNGTGYASTQLPASYLPILLGIQLTEPVWFLFLIGFITTGLRSKEKPELILLTFYWFIIPLLGFIALHSPLYDNFRQIFFILPPVFLVAGAGMDFIFKQIPKPAIKALIMFLLILPGIIAGVRLHPYEYVYYNSLIQDPTGRFELDYWATSYREAAEWLNGTMPGNTVILASGPAQIAQIYIRDDLRVLSETDTSDRIPEYVIVVARDNWEKEVYPDSPIIHEIKRGSLIFTVIKKIER